MTRGAVPAGVKPPGGAPKPRCRVAVKAFQEFRRLSRLLALLERKMPLSAQERIQHLIESHPVVLFMKGNRGRPACGFSAKAVEVLDGLLPNYFAVDVLQDPEIRDGIKAYSNWPTIPQLYIRGEFVGGSDIMLALFESGELEEKLGDLTRPSTPRITLSPAPPPSSRPRSRSRAKRCASTSPRRFSTTSRSACPIRATSSPRSLG